jgi:hypothetical protein
MSHQLTRNNHYVPVWYQKGFLAEGESGLYYLDTCPDERTLPNGRGIVGRSVSKLPPTKCFCTLDLYTTQFGSTLNDEIERYLFGAIDNKGATAVRAFISDDKRAMHESFMAFFEYMDAQKLRTPKGLDWIRSRYPALSQIDLMREMQGLRLMHCTMWTEGVREIVSAEHSDVKFIVTDHPVTIYNAAFPPDSRECAYPSDPSIELIGSQTIFVLDEDTCLILTHLEYAQNPDEAALSSPRTNARFRGNSLARTDAFIRKRKLTRDEVIAINFCLKSRARRYIAAADKDWLHLDRTYNGEWANVGKVLLPRDDLWQFGGEMYVSYKDGSVHYQDAYGRTSGAHEYLRKKSRAAEVRSSDPCGCGSGIEFIRCCERLSQHDRPSWEFYSIRERNLMFCAAVEDILGLRSGKSWDDVRREISDAQVTRIHEAFGSLWPVDTDLTELLPRPNKDVFRAVYLGAPDPRTAAVTITGWLAHFEQVIVAHPFMNPACVRPEYSPTVSPSQHKEQTLKHVLLLFMLEPYIDAGYVHLVPDPADFNGEFGKAAMTMAKDRTTGWKPALDSDERERFERLAKDDFKRFLGRLPGKDLRRMIQKSMPAGIDDTQLDAIIAQIKTDLQNDPYALLQPIEPGEEGAQLKSIKGYCLETAMYLAALSGAIIYTDLRAHWEQLHLHTSAANTASVDEKWKPIVDVAKTITIPVELDWAAVLDARIAGRFSEVGAAIRCMVHAIQGDSDASYASQLASQLAQAADVVQRQCATEPSATRVSGRLEISVPHTGFERNDVRRLLLTFGRAKAIRPVGVAILIRT